MFKKVSEWFKKAMENPYFRFGFNRGIRRRKKALKKKGIDITYTPPED